MVARTPLTQHSWEAEQMDVLSWRPAGIRLAVRFLLAFAFLSYHACVPVFHLVLYWSLAASEYFRFPCAASVCALPVPWGFGILPVCFSQFISVFQVAAQMSAFRRNDVISLFFFSFYSQHFLLHGLP